MKYFIIASFLLLASCGTREDREPVDESKKFLGIINKDQFIPRAYRDKHFDHIPTPENTDMSRYEGQDESYERGYQDGCQTATSAIGEGLARIRGPKIDANELSSNSWYLRGYQDASSYCTFAIDWETH